jgi:hypothetical protein
MEVAELRERIRFFVLDWELNGVRFRTQTLGAKATDSNEVIHEKKERLVLDNMAPFVFNAVEVAWLRSYEDEVIEFLKERDEVA